MKKASSWRAFFRCSVLTALLPVSFALSACSSVSTQQEVEMGAQYATEINRQLPIVSDATVHRAINLIGDDIARYGSRGINYTFYVVDANQVNAFAVPGGYVYVNRGLVERTRNFSELAGVLAHEIGHVEARHGVEQMEKMQNANLGLTLAYVLLGRQPSGVERAAIDVGGGLYFAKHSREAENEADRVAIPLMVAARIHPNGLVTMFEELLRAQQSNSSQVGQWFSTHPTTQERINATRAEIAKLPASRLSGMRTTSSDYNSMKNRLRQLPPARDVASR
ncbi:MAG: M48 family metallopeptidase [Gemmatimonadota bacterium]